MTMPRLIPLALTLLLAACAGGTESGGAPSATGLPPGMQAVAVPGPEGVTLRAALALPEDGPRAPVVIALHGCGGIGGGWEPLHLPARERDWAARLTAAGHPVIFPDSYGSRGHGELCSRNPNPVEAPTLRRADAHAVARWALTQPWAQPGGVLLLGWSHGGASVIEAVRAPVPEGLIRGGVGFYPACRLTLDNGGWRKQPGVDLLLQLADADDWTPARFCRQVVDGQEGVRVVGHAGAYHDFDWPGLMLRTRRLASGMAVTTGFDAAARDAAVAGTMDFFAAHGGPAR